ncbi:hypothetical protein TNCV_102671 [Trichonephila clavipes]|nr:hypothetical protein TNCV_102671 [Trichonephila clavipes]
MFCKISTFPFSGNFRHNSIGDKPRHMYWQYIYPYLPRLGLEVKRMRYQLRCHPRRLIALLLRVRPQSKIQSIDPSSGHFEIVNVIKPRRNLTSASIGTDSTRSERIFWNYTVAAVA